MSDDDWFTKDINDFVLDIKVGAKKPTVCNAAIQISNYVSNFNDSEFGGSYEQTAKSSNSKKNGATKKINNPGKSKQTNIHIQKIPISELLPISEMEPLDVFVAITIQKEQFFETLSCETRMSDKVMQVLITIMAKLCRLPLHETRKFFLCKLFEVTSFWINVYDLITRLSKSSKQKVTGKKILNEGNLDEIMFNVLDFCKFYLRNIHYDNNFIEFVKNIYNCYIYGNDDNRNSVVGNEFEQIIITFNENLDQQMYYEIYPTIEDLKSQSSSVIATLKPNIIKGKYPSVKHYLDIHLALLKEDFISPLRDGITQFLTNPNQKNQNVKIYHDVTFEIITKTKKQKYENLSVNLKNIGNKDNFSEWIRSKSWFNGSLLCFTTDDKFEDLILAVVTKSPINVKDYGYIEVEILKIYNTNTNILKEKFIMFESEVYFDPYHQVYNNLKNLDEFNFPMKNYIIECSTTTEWPDYFPHEENTKLFYETNKIVYDVKDLSTWPQPNAFNLNTDQFIAFQNALTRKFCTIQGPPGTGKTYLGIQIISTLLENRNESILIVCQTNHALDKLLMGLLQYTKEIVRFGSMSKSNSLVPFTMNKLKENIENLDKKLRVLHYMIRMEYEELLAQFTNLNDDLNKPEVCSEEKDKIKNELLILQQKMSVITRRLDELKQMGDYSLIKNKRVIGMTTAYAAKCRTLLNMIKTPIVIIEETAEILESHVIASLNKETQQLIIIGDHQQLRPTNSVYQLALKFKMDISLFERMVKNDISCCKLFIQHRMRPEFTTLLRPAIYKELYDSDIVKTYPNIKGVLKNLFFINHCYPETRPKDETTIKNSFEAKFLVSFCRYLIFQGYKSKEITILTTYNGQSTLITKERNKFVDLHHVRVTAVDNYQGEENRIILLSLVRSNDEKNIGYLSMKNRMCVALSRAREGFYMIGNMRLLSEASKTWKKIENELIQQNAIESFLPLCCETHGNIIIINNADEFRPLKYGGCLSYCKTEYNGNICKMSCHGEYYEHNSD